MRRLLASSRMTCRLRLACGDIFWIILHTLAVGEDGFDTDAMIDGMMEQLMSKDLMYEPMKQVTQRFPSWLDENKSKLSKEEYKE